MMGEETDAGLEHPLADFVIGLPGLCIRFLGQVIEVRSTHETLDSLQVKRRVGLPWFFENTEEI